MKFWLGMMGIAFVTVIVGQWISGMVITYMYQPGDERTTFTSFYLIVQSLVTGTVFWLVFWGYLKKKGVLA